MNPKELVEYAEQNRKLISIATEGNLVKLNYTNACQYDNRWNAFTVMCRGIIIDTTTYHVVAHPFDKFFNEHEYVRQGIEIPVNCPYWITEKLDGVLIIPYRYNGELRLSSRGSFHNEYIDKAYQIKTFNELPLEDFTFMFELISPEYSSGGFLVTKYPKDALVLVGMRETTTNRLLTPPELIRFANSFQLTPYHIIKSLYENLKLQQTEQAGSTEEGWVVFFDWQQGFLVKMKRLEYLQLFRAMKNVNRKTIITMLMQNQLEEFKLKLPEELLPMVITIQGDIEREFQAKCTEVQQIFESIPSEKLSDQREYSLYIISRYPSPLLKYLYKYKSTRDVKDLHSLFYQEILKKD